MTLFKQKYRVESTRLTGWDYSNSGIYFITICTYGMKCYFGEIEKNEMILSQAGKIVNDEWLRTSIVRENVILDDYKVMPNHFHGIIGLEKKVQSKLETTHRVVSTKESKTLQPDSVGSIIGQFKSICTKDIKKFQINFKWQDRFHDRVIRNETELNNVREYIRYNPLKWNEDEYNI